MNDKNNYARNYLHYLSERFDKYTIESNENVLIYCIKCIEEENRRLLWRSVEYLMCIIYLICFPFTHFIYDYSIGQYQIKISLLFDYYRIEYNKFDKKLYINKNVRTSKVLESLFNLNNGKIIGDIVKKKFGLKKLSNLKDEQIYDIALFYSRNIEFYEDLNYYSALLYLYKRCE